MELIGLKSRLIRPGDDVLEVLEGALEREGAALEDGDVLVVSECALATAMGRVVHLQDVKVGRRAMELGRRYCISPELMQLILEHSKMVLGGIEGYVLTLRDGFLCPNAGIDSSNAPDGCVVLPLDDPHAEARSLREGVGKRMGVRIGVVISDSRTHPLRLGCVGIAVGVSGFRGIVDARGQCDLFGKKLAITRKALADNIASAAQLLMGEGDEGVPFVIVRGTGIEIGDIEEGIETIAPQECLYFGSLYFGSISPSELELP
ncbi:MAG: hypothetical protein PWP01_1132 [Methanosarcinales archaeon]|nr:hypothetical protein [Methanosarcinales archaeon]